MLCLRRQTKKANKAIDYEIDAPCQHTYTTTADKVGRIHDRTVRAKRFCLLEYSENGPTQLQRQSCQAHTSYRKPSPMASAPAAPISLPLKSSVWRAVLCLRIHANIPNEATHQATLRCVNRHKTQKPPTSAASTIAQSARDAFACENIRDMA